LTDKPIKLIKRLVAGLENLLVSTCIKRRIREWAVRDYLRVEHKKPPCPFNFAPTTVWWQAFIKIE
jgi:hypothetical protein